MGDERSYSGELEAIRQLRDLGATRVKVSDIEVEFSCAHSSVSTVASVDWDSLLKPTVPEAEPQEDPEASAQQKRRKWEEEQYYSSRGWR